MDISQRIKAGLVKRADQAKILVLRELKSNTSPGKASLSIGLGVLAGLSPLYGLQTVLVLALSFIFRLNRPVALLGCSVTPLPVVPFWVAAGIFTGKIVAPIEIVERLLSAARSTPFFSVLIPWADGLFLYIKNHLPLVATSKIGQESGHEILAGFAQWVIGCSVFALLCAVVTAGVTYPLFKKLRAVRQKFVEKGPTEKQES